MILRKIEETVFDTCCGIRRETRRAALAARSTSCRKPEADRAKRSPPLQDWQLPGLKARLDGPTRRRCRISIFPSFSVREPARRGLFFFVAVKGAGLHPPAPAIPVELVRLTMQATTRPRDVVGGRDVRKRQLVGGFLQLFSESGRDKIRIHAGWRDGNTGFSAQIFCERDQ